MQQWNATFEHDLGHDIGMRLSYTGSHGSNLENFNDLNQVPANTGNPAPLVYPIWGIIQSVVNQAISNYNSYTASGGEADVSRAAVPEQLRAYP